MSRNKRGLQIFIIMMACVLVLAGCNSQNSNTPTNEGANNAPNTNDTSNNTESPSSEGLSGDVLIWVHPMGDPDKLNATWDQVMAGFKELHPNVNLDIQVIPWQNREQKLLTALAASNGPDAFYVIPDQTPLFAAQGIIEPITTQVDPSYLENFTEAAVNAASYKGELYGIPLLQTVVSPYYNVDMIKAIGEDPEQLPETWEEFAAWCEKAKANGHYCFNFSTDVTANTQLYPWIWQNGGQIIDDEGNIEVDTPEVLEAYQWINEAYTKGYIHPDISTNSTQWEEFVSGNMLVTFADNGFSKNHGPDVEDNPIEFEWKLGPILKNKVQATYGTTGTLVVATNSKNKEATVEAALFMTNEENHRMFIDASGFIPSRIDVAKDFTDDPIMTEIGAQAQFNVSGVKDPVARTVMPDVLSELQKLLLNGGSPEEAVKATQSHFETRRGEAGL